MDNFSSEPFYIQSRCEHKMVISVKNDIAKSTAKIVVNKKKDKNDEQHDTQLWIHENRFLINKKSGLVLDAQGGLLKKDVSIILYERKMQDNAHQQWLYREDGFIYPEEDPNVALDIRGGWTEPGTVVLLYSRKHSDNENQLWDLIPATQEAELLTSAEGDNEYNFSPANYAL